MNDDRKYKLLIADDEMIEQAVLYKLLKEKLSEHCEVFRAANGREAVEIHDREGIQIAILDIEMPGINGIAAAEQIREKDRDCCIIFLTAFDEFSYAKKAISVRALDYLLKPYEEKELLLVLEEAMRLAGERSKARERGKEEDIRKSLELAELADLEDDREAVKLSRVVEMIRNIIQSHYMEEISMQDVARHMNYSEAYFCKLFKQCFGQNFTSYLTEYRVNEAKKMLDLPTVNVKDVGKAVGYGDANYFAKVFKRITGQTPTEYRQSANIV